MLESSCCEGLSICFHFPVVDGPVDMQSGGAIAMAADIVAVVVLEEVLVVVVVAAIMMIMTVMVLWIVLGRRRTIMAGQSRLGFMSAGKMFVILTSLVSDCFISWLLMSCNMNYVGI